MIRCPFRPRPPAVAYAAAFFVLLMAPLLRGLALADEGAMTPEKIQNLVLLGKVWGFVKYHHPRLASGELSCDNELLRILPEVLQLAIGTKPGGSSPPGSSRRATRPLVLRARRCPIPSSRSRASTGSAIDPCSAGT